MSFLFCLFRFYYSKTPLILGPSGMSDAG